MSLLVNPTAVIGLPPRSDRAAFSASQRARLIRAMTVVVARQGYVGTVVADVVAQAGVSRKTFYDQFTGMLDCFLAAYDCCIDLLRESVLMTRSADTSGARQLEHVIEAYVGLMMDEPEVARTYLVESFAVGDLVAERRHRTVSEFAHRLADLHTEMIDAGEAGGSHLSPLGYEIIVGSVIAAVTTRVHTRQLSTLPEVIPALKRHVFTALELRGVH